jgi:hypothetical protein
MRSRGQAGAQHSQSAAPGKTADNPKTAGFCPNKAGFICGCVGNLTDSLREHCGNGLPELEGGAMAKYDRETLTVLRNALDGAWALLPDDR